MELLNIGMREKEKLQKIAQGPKNHVKFCIRDHWQTCHGQKAAYWGRCNFQPHQAKVPKNRDLKVILTCDGSVLIPKGTSEWEKTAKAAATTVPVREMEEIVDIKNFSPVSKSISSCVC
ncbi:hypothetical protein QQP08_003559 [Theobroma cacao]|nr:hypothetical protein QQP08_003559 [Theobroma cacao]